ncbi:hypothetical protein AB5J49_02615 [Streptomyces sp. R28]|uniref:Centromere protein J C-terminal domain-containing protein n=1 Tax=Streptomyces sp. R28 TaxID=3238628 RepID=A0AB39PP93_9ACTN
MARISIDYDLMYVLARQVWHLRDELDVSSQTDGTFAAGDIGPRRDTAEELTNFHHAWKKSFREAWQVMTDLGNLLDEIGKAFYDSDAATAANAASMAASYQQANIKAENAAYKQRQDALYKQAEAANLERGNHPGRLALARQKQELEQKRAALQKEQDAQTKRQEGLNKRQEELQKRQEPLRQRQDELTQRQQDLWRRQKAEREELEAGFTAKQDALDKEQAALAKEQNPSLKQVEELLRKQQDLWQEQDAARKTLEGEQAKDQSDLDRERDALQKEQDALAPEWDELDKEQHDLWKDQAASEEAQKQLDKDEEPLRQRAEDMQKSYAAQQEELAKKPAWTPESGEPNPLHMNRELGPDGPAETPPPAEPTTYERDDENGHTKIEYKLDADGRIEVDKNGNPVETKTTITNKNGLRYEETTTQMDDGDYRTVAHHADGSVTKVVVDNESFTLVDTEPTTRRYVVNEDDEILAVWQKKPGSDDWELTNSIDEENATLGHLPDHLRVDHSIIDKTGQLRDGTPATETTKTFPPDDTGKHTTVTAYKTSDGSVTKVLTTTDGPNEMRYVTDADGKVLEFWRNTVWYQEGGPVSAGPMQLQNSRRIPEYTENGWAFPELDAEQKRKADEVTP